MTGRENLNRQKLDVLNAALCAYIDKDITACELVSEMIEAEVRPNLEGPGWLSALDKLETFILQFDRADNFQTPPFSIIGEGNGKLPFLTFSTLPVLTCPGAGDCVEFCYSLKAWRYPNAWARQFQNTLLLSTRKGRWMIRRALDKQLSRPKYATLEQVDFRLYVDGDFAHVGDIHFWMQTLRARPQLAAYGYSKSFYEFLAYDVKLALCEKEWPSNYVLNLSSGHKHSPEMLREMRELPIVRGDFVAVQLPANATKKPGAQQRKELREAFGQKAFTCPGKCGDCTPKGHACGSMRFAQTPIIIAVH